MNLGTHNTSRISWNSLSKDYHYVNPSNNQSCAKCAVIASVLSPFVSHHQVYIPRFKMLRVVANLLILVVVATHVKAKDQKKGKFV